MKKFMFSVVAIAIMSLLVLPSWAGGPGETGRKWLERTNESGIFPEMLPEEAQIYFLDLLSNAGGWASILVITNWDTQMRIRVITEFIPGDGTPSDLIRREHYINPNAVKYLTENELGFLRYGRTNWFGVVIADVLD